jgi:hypothetical protein
VLARATGSIESARGAWRARVCAQPKFQIAHDLRWRTQARAGAANGAQAMSP